MFKQKCFKSLVKRGKDYLEYCKLLNKIAIKMYGLGFVFCTPSTRAKLIECLNNYLNYLP